MKRKIFSILIATSMILTLSVSYSFAQTGDILPKKYEISSMKILNEAISDASTNGKLTMSEKSEIVDDMSPQVMADYIKEIDETAANYFEKATPIKETYNTETSESSAVYRTNIDPLTSVELVLTDREEEQSQLTSIGKKIKNFFVDECYAATNGQTIWKKYDNRYYTAKYTRSIGPGTATICTENHYTISKGKIKERYGKTWLDSMASITGDISDKGYSVYAAATKPGASTGIRARTTFKYKISGAGTSATSYYTVYENLKIKFIKDNPSKRKMKVQYSWNKTSV